LRFKVAVVTAGHLATCPRMLKAADALSEEGYEVEVVSTLGTTWASTADRDVYARRAGKWRWTVVDYRKKTAPGTYLQSGIRQRLARALAGRLSRVPRRVARRAFGRVHDELVRAAGATGADFFYGGTSGGIAATAEVAGSRPYALDLEDFYSGDCAPGSLDARLASLIESSILKDARFLTAGSEAIAEAYRATYGVPPVPIHNTFSLPKAAPDFASRADGPLRLYWFSQTIGAGRGLEQAIEALGISGIEAVLHLRGVPSVGFDARALAAAKAPRLVVETLSPGLPDEMTELASGYDVGLSLEQRVSRNRELCLTNKAFLYMLAGLALALTSTPGQRSLASELEESAVIVPPGDVSSLASALSRLANDPERLLRYRRASWEAATRRWHWEHPEERGKLLQLFREATERR
jgi:glycosyltransferase involved in cell wall biosynthesis